MAGIKGDSVGAAAAPTTKTVEEAEEETFLLSSFPLTVTWEPRFQ